MVFGVAAGYHAGCCYAAAAGSFFDIPPLAAVFFQAADSATFPLFGGAARESSGDTGACVFSPAASLQGSGFSIFCAFV